MIGSQIDWYRENFPGQELPSFGPAPVSSPLTDTQKSVITGTKLDDDFAAATIGKDIALFVGGTIFAALRLYEGPFLTTVDGAVFVSLIGGPFMRAVPGADIYIDAISLNGTPSFESADEGATFDPLGSVFDDVVIGWKPGSETQTPFASSITRYGARAVPYRSHPCIEMQDIPLEPFANVIPLMSARFVQEESLTRQEALERILRFARFDDSEFQVFVSGEDTFWIKIKNQNLFEFLQDNRTIFRNWNIVATDKLRIFENSSTVTPIDVDRDDVSVDSIKFWRDAPETVPAERTLGVVDTDGDNDFYTTPPARRARYPIPLTASQSTQSIELPIGMGRLQAKTLVNKSLLIDEFARDKCSFKLLPHMRGIEPGDILALDFDQEYPYWRVLSIARNATDYTSDAVCERIEMSLLPTGPSITSNGGGATASITINENTTAVTTVTADQSGTFSIVGGDDSSFFTIHPTTGVLTITARDYESPADTGANNTYQVIVQILADGLAGTQIITVTIANVADAGDAPVMDFSNETNSQLLAVLEDF